MNTPILFSYRFKPEGGVESSDVSSLIENEDQAWVHVDASHDEARPWLEEHLFLDSHILDALLDSDARPRVLVENGAAVLLLRGINLNRNASPEDMVNLRIYVDRSKVVTLRGRRLMAATDVEATYLETDEVLSRGQVVCDLIAAVLKRISEVISDLDDRLDEVEEKVITSSDSDLRGEINTIRRQAIVLHRYISPQVEAMSSLLRHRFDWLGSVVQEHMIESQNHMLRYVEDLSAIRDRSQIVKDEVSHTLSEQMNKNTFILTTVAAVFLPISFLTGLLGVNLRGIPCSESELAFWFFCGFLAVITVIVVLLIKKMKWF